jgi:Skp family chaperone for outer membrane proteins
MKRILLIIAALVLFAIAAISGAAQTRPAATPTPTAPTATPAAPATPVAKPNVPNTKIAVVDTSAFTDEKAGIKRYLNAVKAVEREFEPKNVEFKNLQSRLKSLADEIDKLGASTVVAPSSIQAKREEAERLQRDLKYKKEQADADVERRYKEVVGPVSTDIGKALDQFATQNGITMILDISKLLPAVLSVNPAVDVTEAFIAEYNSKNP